MASSSAKSPWKKLFFIFFLATLVVIPSFSTSRGDTMAMLQNRRKPELADGSKNHGLGLILFNMLPKGQPVSPSAPSKRHNSVDGFDLRGFRFQMSNFYPHCRHHDSISEVRWPTIRSASPLSTLHSFADAMHIWKKNKTTPLFLWFMTDMDKEHKNFGLSMVCDTDLEERRFVEFGGQTKVGVL
ncbi:hypothetical protein L6452_18215 [Arctium lappa]|uniref:Uncharacterized protein n=1 Tax=Arctium lappa TaxID=4217 RepID=A0ACB9C5J0_ARCLA|nr:hypothetical protein L6452_18215 [Arctium lappa]